MQASNSLVSLYFDQCGSCSRSALCWHQYLLELHFYFSKLPRLNYNLSQWLRSLYIGCVVLHMYVLVFSTPFIGLHPLHFFFISSFYMDSCLTCF